MLYKVDGSMRLDFSSFPLDVFNNPKCAELLNISEILPSSEQENQVSELVIEKTLLKTLKKIKMNYQNKMKKLNYTKIHL